MPSPQGDVRLDRLGGPEPGVRRAVLVVAALLLIAAAKPWGWANGPPDTRTARASPTEAARRTEAPTLQPLRLAHSVLLTSASILESGTAPVGGDVACYPSTGWRIATVDGAGVGRLRTWYNLVPGWGAGPTDPAIPLVRVFARDLVALGFCAPTADGQALATAEVRGWQIERGRAARIELGRLSGSSPRDAALGSLFGSPPVSDGPATGSATGSATGPAGGGSWPDGQYVFVIRAGQADEEDIWFGVDVTRIVDASGGAVPNGGTAAHASP